VAGSPPGWGVEVELGKTAVGDDGLLIVQQRVALPLAALRVRVISGTSLSFFVGTVAGVPLEAATATVAVPAGHAAKLISVLCCASGI
jgi:hypothetical protein